MLEQSNIARHEGGRGEAQHLPEGEVPRHHGQDHTHRLVMNVAAGRIGLHYLISQEALAVVRIVAAPASTLHNLGHRRLEGLTHLSGDDTCKLILLSLEDVGCALESFFSLINRCLAIIPESHDRPLQLFFNLLAGKRLKGANSLTCGRIRTCYCVPGCYCHHDYLNSRSWTALSQIANIQCSSLTSPTRCAIIRCPSRHLYNSQG